MPSVVAVVAPAVLPKLATKRLLALRDRLLACEESLAASDVYPEDVASEIDPAKIRFKDDPRWVLLYDAVKAELSTREHVPRGDELRAQRLAQRQQGSRKGRSTQRTPRR